MSALDNFTDKFKHFRPTTWSVTNKTAIYLLMLIVSGIGIFQFVTLPKEQFPDIVIPTIYVSTIYTGNSPKDMENLVTRPIEKQIKAITGAKINKFTSTSQQDYSAIVVEFETDVPNRRGAPEGQRRYRQSQTGSANRPDPAAYRAGSEFFRSAHHVRQYQRRLRPAAAEEDSRTT